MAHRPNDPLRLVPPIHRATHRIGLYLAEAGGHGLSQGESHILAQLAASAPATVGDLHRGLAHKRSTLTSILDRLVERGYVTRDVGTTDRRTVVIGLTPAGRQVARRVLRTLASLEHAVARRVSEREIQACLNVLSVVEYEARRTNPRDRRNEPRERKNERP